MMQIPSWSPFCLKASHASICSWNKGTTISHRLRGLPWWMLTCNCFWVLISFLSALYIMFLSNKDFCIFFLQWKNIFLLFLRQANCIDFLDSSSTVTLFGESSKTKSGHSCWTHSCISQMGTWGPLQFYAISVTLWSRSVSSSSRL